MNYLAQINGFWRWRRLNQLTSKQVNLYFAILDCVNSACWQQPCAIPNGTLMGMCAVSQSEFFRSRQALIDKGLIRYQAGSKDIAGRYELPLLYQADESKAGGNRVSDPASKGGNINKQKDKQNSYYAKKSQGRRETPSKLMGSSDYSDVYREVLKPLRRDDNG